MTRDYLQLHFIVLIWGFTAILGLLITIPAVEVVFYRTLIAFIALGIMLYFQRKSFKLGAIPIIKMLLTGALIGIHWILFFQSARVSNASVSLTGFATCAFWTSLIEPMMYKRKIRMIEVVLGITVLIGLYVVFQVGDEYLLGLVLAILCAILGAVFTVINGQFVYRYDAYMISFYEMIGAFLVTVLFFPLYVAYYSESGQLELSPTTMDWLYLGILAIICTVYAYSISVKIMEKLSPFTINLTVNLEPIYGIVMALLIFKDSEKMQPGFYLGAALILLSVFVYPIYNKLKKRKAMGLDNLR
ncbi:MAG: DMT family transporter [Bacteroidota bacterium]